MLLLMALFLLFLNNGLTAQPVITGESWADIGKDTTLICSAGDGVLIDLVRWKDSSFDNSDIDETVLIVRLVIASGVVTNRDETHYGFDSNDPYPLTIKQVTLDDEARYWCEVVVTATGAYMSNFKDTHIRVPPAAVSLTYKNTLYNDQADVIVVAGDGHPFSCKTLGIKPNAHFTWTLQSATLYQELGITSPNSGDSRLSDSSSTVSVNVPESPATQRLTCGATNRQNGSTDTEKDTTVNLQVKVPPISSKITLSGTNEDGTLSVDQGVLKTITCIVMDTRPAAMIKWYLNGVMQSTGTVAPPSADSDELYDTTGSWSFIPTRDNHEDVVMCQASTTESQGELPNVTAVLNVNGPPDVPNITGNTQMTENMQTSLTCAADMGYPNDWSLHWFNEEVPITPNPTTTPSPSSSGNRFMFTSTLDFTPMREDNGHTTIKCNAQRNSMSTSTGMLGPIQVQFCARSVSIEDCVTATAGSAAVLRCVSDSSNPATTLTWSRDGVNQTNTSPQPESGGSNGGIIATLDLTTNDLTKNDNGAVFQCSASNDVVTCGVDGVDVIDSCALNVQYTPEFTEVTVNPETPVIEGGEVILTCTADANPKPSNFIIWEKLVSFSTVLSSVYSDGTSTLTLSDIQKDQAGSYRCKANNEIPSSGSDVFSDPVTVKVLYEVEITNKDENEMGVNGGEDAVLSCKAVGNPAPVMTWYDPNTTVISSTRNLDKYQVEDTTTSGNDIYGFMVTSNLTIQGVDSQVDYGFYTCNSSNGIGQVDMLRVFLNGTRRPNKPTNVSMTGRTSSSITVSWIAGYDGGETQWFHVSHETSGSSSETFSDRIEGGVTPYNVTGLESYTEYEIRVYAENDVDRNPNTGSIVEYTLPLPPGEGFTIEFNTVKGEVTISKLTGKGGCIQLEVTYGGGSTDWKTCGNCIKTDDVVILAERCPQTRKRRRRAPGNVVDVRARFCQETGHVELCSKPTSTKKVTTSSGGQGSDSTGIIAGGVVGGVVLLVIIVGLIVYLKRTSLNKPTGTEISSSIELATDNFGQNGQVNEGLRGSGGAETNAKPIERLTTDSGDTYAIVKKEKRPHPKAPPQNLPDVTYAEVNKKTPVAGLAKKPKKYVPPSKVTEESDYDDVKVPQQNKKSKSGAGSSGYEEVNLDSPKTPANYDDGEGDYANLTEPQSDSGRTVNEDGLIYMEVGHLKSHPVNQPPIQTEESTTYASIDFLKKTPDVARN